MLAANRVRAGEHLSCRVTPELIPPRAYGRMAKVTAELPTGGKVRSSPWAA